MNLTSEFPSRIADSLIWWEKQALFFFFCNIPPQMVDVIFTWSFRMYLVRCYLKSYTIIFQQLNRPLARKPKTPKPLATNVQVLRTSHQIESIMPIVIFYFSSIIIIHFLYSFVLQPHLYCNRFNWNTRVTSNTHMNRRTEKRDSKWKNKNRVPDVRLQIIMFNIGYNNVQKLNALQVQHDKPQ